MPSIIMMMLLPDSEYKTNVQIKSIIIIRQKNMLINMQVSRIINPPIVPWQFRVSDF